MTKISSLELKKGIGSEVHSCILLKIGYESCRDGRGINVRKYDFRTSECFVERKTRENRPSLAPIPADLHPVVSHPPSDDLPATVSARMTARVRVPICVVVVVAMDCSSNFLGRRPAGNFDLQKRIHFQQKKWVGYSKIFIITFSSCRNCFH